MIQVYVPREGIFEIYDQELINERSQMVLRYNLWRIISLICVLGMAVSLILSITVSLWFLFGLVLLPASYYSYRNTEKTSANLSPQISTLVLSFDNDTKIQSMRIRKWMPNEADKYTEHSVRYNQAIGFKAIWFYNGKIVIEIIVDPDFPGNPIFETYDFYSLAEMIVFLENVLPEADKWYYQLEDGSEWHPEQKKELNDDVQAAKIPWNVRDYFS